jgi:hypothetical protein
LKNLGHRVARSTVATILKEEGISPSDERPTSWQVLMRAHWNAFMAADFFTTGVWTVRGLILLPRGVAQERVKWSGGIVGHYGHTGIDLCFIWLSRGASG